MSNAQLLYPKRVPILFSKDPNHRGLNIPVRRVPMVAVPASDHIAKASGTVDATKLSLAQLEALSQESLITWVCATRPVVDGKVFDFDRHRYLIPLYSDESREIVIKKGSQTGASTFMFLDTVHALGKRPIKAGIYLPTEGLIYTMARDRIDPILEANPDFIRSREASNSVKLKHIGQGSLYLLYMGGKDSKDSVPLDKITFDEVRLMNMSDVEQALERVAASAHKIVRWLSTPGYPGQDIDRLFKLSTQGHWHCKCRCQDGTCLALNFPNCVMVHKGETFYICPKCRTRIKDPQNGYYVEYNPGHERKGYHFNQLVAGILSPKEVWSKYNETSNMKEFYNAKLGLAYEDMANVSITLADLESCVNTDLKWGAVYEHTYMGVDQMDGLNVVSIIANTAEGKKQLVHLEWVDNKAPRYKTATGSIRSPFYRLHELMDKYNVKYCVVDQLPNTNEALQFAQSFPGRVYMALYTNAGRDIVQWTDRERETQKKSSDKIKYKYRCILNRYSAIEAMFTMWKDRQISCPNPQSLIQDVRSKAGQFVAASVGNLMFSHLQGVIREKFVTNEKTGEFTMRWVNREFDPHFVHAMTYAFIASERALGHRSLSF